MRGAFGKPQGIVARVNIGQPIMSIRSSDKYKAAIIESLRRAKKFPGRQKIFCWWKKLRIQITYIAFFEIDLRLQKMGIHQFEQGVYKKMKENAQLEPDGANVKYRPDHGPLAVWRTIFGQQ